MSICKILLLACKKNKMESDENCEKRKKVAVINNGNKPNTVHSIQSEARSAKDSTICTKLIV